MKKVAIVDYVGIKAGMHYYSLSLLKALSERGFETFYFSNVPSNSEDSEHTHIIPCFPLQPKKSISSLFSIIQSTLRSAVALKQKGVNNLVYHVFEASFLTLFMLSTYRLFQFKLIGIVHDVKPFKGNNVKWIESLINNHLLSKITVHNQFSKDQIVKSDTFKRRTPISIIPHGNYNNQLGEPIDVNKAKAKLGLDTKKEYVLFFGQIKGTKGLDVLLKAFPKDSPANLIIAGKVWKEDFSKYQKIIEERNLTKKVHLYIRHISDTERDLFFRAALFIVLPYKKIYQSGVLLMAMTYGLPAIVSDLSAFKELGENIVLKFENRNYKMLRDKIKQAYQNPTLLQSLSANSKQMANQQHSWKSIAKLYEDSLL